MVELASGLHTVVNEGMLMGSASANSKIIQPWPPENSCILAWDSLVAYALHGVHPCVCALSLIWARHGPQE